MRIIKRYGNRCLYDTNISATVTIQDLKRFVLNSEEFKVINAKTKEDITRRYLIQIILELEYLDNPLFSDETLKTIIKCNGGVMQGWLKNYLEQSLRIMYTPMSFTIK